MRFNANAGSELMWESFVYVLNRLCITVLQNSDFGSDIRMCLCKQPSQIQQIFLYLRRFQASVTHRDHSRLEMLEHFLLIVIFGDSKEVQVIKKKGILTEVSLWTTAWLRQLSVTKAWTPEWWSWTICGILLRRQMGTLSLYIGFQGAAHYSLSRCICDSLDLHVLFFFSFFFSLAQPLARPLASLGLRCGIETRTCVQSCHECVEANTEL